LTGSTVKVHPTTTTVYTVTVTDGCGILPPATATDTVFIDTTCCIGKSITHISNGKSSSYISFKGFGTGNPLSLSGTFTVNTNFTITHCSDVEMGGKTIIDVQAPNTLTIDSSRLYACTNMWNGIIVEPGASLIIKNKSIIEDAVTGIEGQNSSSLTSAISVDSSELNNNFEDIHIDPYFVTTGMYPLTLHHATLICSKDGSFSPNAYLKPPYAVGTITFTGVYLDSVQGSGVTVGDFSNSAFTNTFNNMQFGVQGFNSNFYVYNNNFTGLLGNPTIACFHCPPPPPPIGMGVVANATAFAPHNPATYFTVVVGGGGANQPNAFTSCYRGVDVTNYAFTTVNYNSFFNKTNFTLPGRATLGDHAVYVKIELGKLMEVNNNIITNFATGIHVHRTQVGAAFTMPFENINNNALEILNNGYMIDGILVENAVLSQFAPVNIMNNTVDDANTCIWVRNFDEDAAIIQGNSDIRIKKTSSAFVTTEKSGIRVDHCIDFIQVIDNPNIYTNGTFLRKPPTVPADTDVIGININLSQGVLVQCNGMFNVGQCMRFAQNCIGARIYSNTMTSVGTQCYDGLVLWNNAILAPQGGLSQPIGDIWTDTASFLNSMTYTYFTKNPGKNSPLWLKDSLMPNYPLKKFNKTNGFPGADDYNEKSPKALNVSTSGTAPACPPPCSSCHVATNSILNNIATNTVQLAVFVPQTQFINQQVVFAKISRDTSLMSGDTVLQNFYSSEVNTTLGGIYAVQQQMQQGNFTSAQVINNSLVPSSAIEQNHQTVDNIFLSTLAVGNVPSSAQLDELEEIANECPYLGGQAVYEARSLLNLFLNSDIHYGDSCTSPTTDRSVQLPEHAYQPFVNAKVYPNPASTTVTIETIVPKGQSGRITFYSMLGDNVLSKDLKNNLTSCDISQLKDGMYFYKIEITGQVASIGKLVITR